MMGMSHLISEFYPNPEMPSTLLKMNLAPSKARRLYLARQLSANMRLPEECLFILDVSPALWILFPMHLPLSVLQLL